jgi:WD40 repeat protein
VVSQPRLPFAAPRATRTQLLQPRNTGHQVTGPLTGHTGTVLGVCTVPGLETTSQREGPALLAAAGDDGTVRIWDPANRPPGHRTADRAHRPHGPGDLEAVLPARTAIDWSTPSTRIVLLAPSAPHRPVVGAAMTTGRCRFPLIRI